MAKRNNLVDSAEETMAQSLSLTVKYPKKQSGHGCKFVELIEPLCELPRLRCDYCRNRFSTLWRTDFTYVKVCDLCVPGDDEKLTIDVSIRNERAHIARLFGIAVMISMMCDGALGMHPNEMTVQLYATQLNFIQSIFLYILVAGLSYLLIRQFCTILDAVRQILINLNMTVTFGRTTAENFSNWLPGEYNRGRESFLREYIELKAQAKEALEQYKKAYMISLAAQLGIGLLGLIMIPIGFFFSRNTPQRQFEYVPEGFCKTGFKVSQTVKGLLAFLGLGFLVFGNKKRAHAIKEWWSMMFMHPDAWAFIKTVRQWCKGEDVDIDVPESVFGEDTKEAKEFVNVMGETRKNVPRTRDDVKVMNAKRCETCSRKTSLMLHYKGKQMCASCVHKKSRECSHCDAKNVDLVSITQGKYINEKMCADCAMNLSRLSVNKKEVTKTSATWEESNLTDYGRPGLGSDECKAMMKEYESVQNLKEIDEHMKQVEKGRELLSHQPVEDAEAVLNYVTALAKSRPHGWRARCEEWVNWFLLTACPEIKSKVLAAFKGMPADDVWIDGFTQEIMKEPALHYMRDHMIIMCSPPGSSWGIDVINNHKMKEAEDKEKEFQEEMKKQNSPSDNIFDELHEYIREEIEREASVTKEVEVVPENTDWKRRWSRAKRVLALTYKELKEDFYWLMTCEEMKVYRNIYIFAVSFLAIQAGVYLVNGSRTTVEEMLPEGDQRKGSNSNKRKNRGKKFTTRTKHWEIYKGASGGAVDVGDLVELYDENDEVYDQMDYSEFIETLDDKRSFDKAHFIPDKRGLIRFRANGHKMYAAFRESQEVPEACRRTLREQRKQQIVDKLDMVSTYYKKMKCCPRCGRKHGGKCTYKMGDNDKVKEKLIELHNITYADSPEKPESILFGLNPISMDDLNGRLGQTYSGKDFTQNCFLYGNKVIVLKHGVSDSGEFFDDIVFKFPGATYKPSGQYVSHPEIDDFGYFPVQVDKKFNKVVLRAPQIGESVTLVAWNGKGMYPCMSSGVIGFSGYHTCSSTFGFCSGVLVALKDKAVVGFHCAGGQRTNRCWPVDDAMLKHLN